MPTYDEFVADWASKYYIIRDQNASQEGGTTGAKGSDVLTIHGSFNSTLGNLEPIRMNLTNNEIYYDTTNVASGYKHATGTIGFCVLFPGAYVTPNLSSSTDLGGRPFLLLSVSDPAGTGIVKFSTLDTTTAAPTLTSIEYEVNLT
jgi:hypothetical protein